MHVGLKGKFVHRLFIIENKQNFFSVDSVFVKKIISNMNVICHVFVLFFPHLIYHLIYFEIICPLVNQEK